MTPFLTIIFSFIKDVYIAMSKIWDLQINMKTVVPKSIRK